MKKFLLTTLLLLGFFPMLHATHIVGGEIELRHISGDTYRINLIMYFDVINGDPGARDPGVTVGIFEKKTNGMVASYSLPRLASSLVPYRNPVCGGARLQTERIIYSRVVELNAGEYRDSLGYYISWERCCRNNTISNIVQPEASGQTFYMEFPPLFRNGVRFYDSSPNNFPAIGDYLCVDEPFFFDFGGNDPDGDQLVYSLVTPLRGYSSPLDAAPPLLPAPYAPVTWSPGSNEGNMIPGSPSLGITRNGELILRPSAVGLFVFGVRCEEFRNGVKLGEVRRDFQLLVVDCRVPQPPVAALKHPQQPGLYREGEIIRLKPNDKGCTYLAVTSPNGRTDIEVTVKPVNYTRTGGDLTFTSSGTISSRSDTLKLPVCFPSCPNPDALDKPYIMDFIVKDKSACPVPLYDTVRVTVEVIYEPGEKPIVSVPLPYDPVGNFYVKEIPIGESLSLPVTGTDKDNDVLSLTGQGVGFNLSTVGMIFPAVNGTGTVTQNFTWKPDCALLKPGETEKDFMVRFVVRELKPCNFAVRDDTITVKFVVTNKAINLLPVLSTDLTTYDGATRTYSATVYAGEELVFEATATDADRDVVSINATGNGFSLADVGMQFTSVTGTAPQKTVLRWKTDCGMLAGKTDLEIRLVANDQRLCNFNGYDTVKVRLKLADRVLEKPFVPYNVFTPNGDNYNNTFKLFPVLPPDNCKDQFKKISIYNRWGRIVFESTDRKFEWTGDEFPSGVYFYYIEYQYSKYKGTVTLLRGDMD